MRAPPRPTEGLSAFYPIAADAKGVGRLARLGARTVQLRAKSLAGDMLRREIGEAFEAALGSGCQLVVNDHWREAMSVGADYVHLGQEDLAEADVAALKANGIRLGMSTHDPEELAVALAAEPDYVALGPIYATTTKAVAAKPQGLAPLRNWRQRIGTLPLVAIGGITLETADDVIAAGADSVAVISDAADDDRVARWVAWDVRQRGRRLGA
jgi:thiamine-phosphate pyrophosphorylase